MIKLFVAGPSGSGKTTVGDELEQKFGWTHFDCENFHLSSDAATFSRFCESPMLFIPAAERVVVTWGFIPAFIGPVRKILDAGFCSVWLTGRKSHLDASILERGLREPDRSTDPKYFEIAQTSEELLSPCTTIQAFRSDGTRRDISHLIHHSVSGAEAAQSSQNTLTTDAPHAECVITAAMAHPASDIL